MPEGDTIHRAAGTLSRALTGQRVLNLTSVYPALTRLEESSSAVRGRTVDGVFARGKHLFIRFSGELCLRTHMRMSGSWHIYRRNEPWKKSRRNARIVIETEDWTAVGFSVPDASLGECRAMEADGPSPSIDLLSDRFDPNPVIAAMRSHETTTIAEVLLNQQVMAGVGNVYKSEILFLAGTDPFMLVRDIPPPKRSEIIELARSLLAANVAGGRPGMRTTLHSLDPSVRLWVYGRRGKPCLRCGTMIQMKKHGLDARSTYWCAECQRQN